VSKKPSNSTGASKVTKGKASLLGIGLDGDGHKRLTSGEQFAILGGSQETHERMTETVVKTFEELKRRDRNLDSVDPKELEEIILKSSPA